MSPETNSAEAAPFTAQGLAEFSKAAGESEALALLRTEHLERFESGDLSSGRYTRLLLDWRGLPAREPLFGEAHLEGEAWETLSGPDGARWTRLSEAASRDTGVLSSLAGTSSAWDDLVLAGWREGALLRWGPGETSTKPFCMGIGDPGGLVLEPLVLDVGERAEADIFLHWKGGADPASMRFTLLGGKVGAGARLRLFLLHEGGQEHHRLASGIDVGRDASVEIFSAWTSGRWRTVRYRAGMAEPGSSWKESHIVFSDGREHFDLDSQVEQRAPHTRCDVQVKTVASGSSRSVFTGNLLMEKEAVLSEASLGDHVLLLSPKAHADSIPGLEIKAMDVKAAHAASVGQVDEEQLFYMESRGLDPDEARRLAVLGFLESLLERAPFPSVEEVVTPILEGRIKP